MKDVFVSFHYDERNRKLAWQVISASVTDRRFVRELTQGLTEQGVEILNEQDVSQGGTWAPSYRDIVSQADQVVVVISGELGGFADEEIHEAVQQNKPLLPVLVGEDAVLPPQLSGTDAHHVDSVAQAPAVADLVAARVKDLVYEEE